MNRFAPLSTAALTLALAFALPATLLPQESAAATVAVSITVPPPPLPVYAQPALPAPGYVWAPGYWAWGPVGYYWVPGTWVQPPAVGLLWTPGYWGWAHGRYFWHAGYWGPAVGFYGGINYGFGYFGVGYVGGHWDHDRFFYNRAVNNFGHARITDVYTDPVRHGSTTHMSFNGGRGTNARPSAEQEFAARGRHVEPTGAQLRHEHAAAQNRAFRASVNHGHPAVGATAHPASFGGSGVAHTRNAAAAPSTHNAAHGGRYAPHQAPAAHQASAPHAQPPHASGHAERRRNAGRGDGGQGGEPGGGHGGGHGGH